MPAASAVSLIPRQTSVNTTDATVTVLDTIPMGVLTAPVNTIEVYVTAARTGGASGTAGDSAGYIKTGVFKNVAGTVTLVGSVVNVMTSEDQAAWDVTLTVNGQNIEVRVTGASGNNITWTAYTNVIRGV